jgi:hypothetical protein
MAEPDVPEINVDKIMAHIREEVKKRKLLRAGNFAQDTACSQQPSDPLIASQLSRSTRRDRLLWKYGTRYGNVINRIPILKYIANKNYLRLVRPQTLNAGNQAPFSSDQSGGHFIGRNWYYSEYIEQTQKEGLKGRIKLFILKYFGFFAWWQAQVNKALYQEITRLNDLIENNEKSIQESMDQNAEMRQQIANLRVAKADEKAVQAFRGELRSLKTSVAENQSLEGIQSEVRDILTELKNHEHLLSDQQRRLTLLLQETGNRLPESMPTSQRTKVDVDKEGD